METLNRSDDNNKPDERKSLDHLSLEKQLTHRIFCEQLRTISSLEQLKGLTEELHLLYLGQTQMFITMAKNDFK
jgi:hypothetical protein